MSVSDCYAPHAMPHHDAAPTAPAPDPWRAFADLLAGVILYGGLGWLADRWLGTSYLVAVGIVLGFALGAYLVFKKFGMQPENGSTGPVAGSTQPTGRDKTTEQ